MKTNEKIVTIYYGKDGNPCESIEEAYCMEFTTFDESGCVVGYARSAVEGRPFVYPNEQAIPISPSQRTELEKSILNDI